MEIFFFDIYAKVRIFDNEKIIFTRIKHYLKEFNFSLVNNEILIKKKNNNNGHLLAC